MYFSPLVAEGGTDMLDVVALLLVACRGDLSAMALPAQQDG